MVPLRIFPPRLQEAAVDAIITGKRKAPFWNMATNRHFDDTVDQSTWEAMTWRIIPVSKWLITMVNKLSRVGALPNGLHGLEMGVTNHLLNGMILQVGPLRFQLNC